MAQRKPHKTRILLAEDNPDHQQLLQMGLTDGRPDVEIHVVASGAELLRVSREAGPDGFDCIVLDYYLPDARAEELVPQVQEQGIRCPTVVISSSQEQTVVVNSIRAGGVVDFVPKTEAIEGNGLRERVSAAIVRWRRQEAEKRRNALRERRLTALTEEDPLTGLLSRRWLDRVLCDRRQRLDRRGRLSVAMIDVDFFRQVNSTYGHPGGDAALRGIADVLRSCANPGDSLCRYGGEEFLVLRPATTYSETMVWAQHLRRKVADLNVTYGGAVIPLTISLGVVNRTNCHVDMQMIWQADQAMYQAKALGRNRVCTWEMVAFDRAVSGVLAFTAPSLEARLREVLANCETHLGATQRDHLTSHAEYVAKMALRLGRVLGMGEAALERLRIAGLCHDLGKFLVPEDVLAKPSSLSPDERLVVSWHAGDGADMCLRLGADVETADYVRYHHTRFDEDGAAGGRRGRETPLGARILAVADAFVTMTSERSYCTARSFTATIHELHRVAGAQFDPKVVYAIPAALLSDIPKRQANGPSAVVSVGDDAAMAVESR